METSTLNEMHLARDAAFAPPPPTGSAQGSRPLAKGPAETADIRAVARACLDDMKALEVVEIDLAGKTALADAMLIASGNSQRHVGSIADRIVEQLKEHGFGRVRVEGMPACDWVLIDAGDVIVHVFRPEVRSFYNLEKMWGADRPIDRVAV
jgi:ribosome-associated protein